MSTATQLLESIEKKKQADLEKSWPQYDKLLLQMAKGSDKIDLDSADETMKSVGVTAEQLTEGVENKTKRLRAIQSHKDGMVAGKELQELEDQDRALQKELADFHANHKQRQKELTTKMQAASRKHGAGVSAATFLTDIKNVLDPTLKRQHEEIKQRRIEAVQKVRQIEENLKFLDNDLLGLATDDDAGRVAPSTLKRDKARADELKKRIAELKSQIREIETVEMGAIESDATKLREKLLKTV